MNQGISLSELAARIEQAAETQQDLLSPAKQLEVIVAGDQVGVDIKGHAIVEPTDVAHQQLAAHLSIPKIYWDRLREKDPELLATNANRWLRESPETRLLRLQDGHLRAYVSDSYKRLDHPIALRETLEAVSAADTKVQCLSSNLTGFGERLDLKLLFPEVHGEVKEGDVLRAGIAISNSETGGGSFAVQPFLYRDFCTNGMVFGRTNIAEAVRRRHAGARLTEVNWQNDTLEVEAELLGKQTRDLVATVASQEALDKLLEPCRRAAETAPVEDPEAAIKVLAKEYRLSDSERSKALINLIEDRDLSLWGVTNAVTKLANDSESYARSTELESLGSQLLTMQLRDWDRVRLAA